jgi:hypothetical protein
MFTFNTTDGAEHKVFFKHERELVPANPSKAKSSPHYRPYATVCTIMRDDNIVGRARVVKHVNDNPCYKAARKYSLQQALDVAEIDRASRRNAWMALQKK